MMWIFLGNEMRCGSVDAAIAENLLSKGNPFCPILNPEMDVKLIDIHARHSLIEGDEENVVEQITENPSKSSKM